MESFVMGIQHLVDRLVVLAIQETAINRFRLGVIVVVVVRLRYVRFQIRAFRLGNCVILVVHIVDWLVALVTLANAVARVTVI